MSDIVQLTISELMNLKNDPDICNDPEHAHSEADELLLECLTELGHTDLVKTYRDLRNHIGFWYA